MRIGIGIGSAWKVEAMVLEVGREGERPPGWIAWQHCSMVNGKWQKTDRQAARVDGDSRGLTCQVAVGRVEPCACVHGPPAKDPAPVAARASTTTLSKWPEAEGR